LAYFVLFPHSNGDFSRKLQILLTPVYLTPANERVPLGTGYRCSGARKLEWRSFRVEKEVWRYLQPSGYNTRMWQTDGRTPDDSKDRAYA